MRYLPTCILFCYGAHPQLATGDPEVIHGIRDHKEQSSHAQATELWGHIEQVMAVGIEFVATQSIQSKSLSSFSGPRTTICLCSPP